MTKTIPPTPVLIGFKSKNINFKFGIEPHMQKYFSKRHACTVTELSVKEILDTLSDEYSIFIIENRKLHPFCQVEKIKNIYAFLDKLVLKKLRSKNTQQKSGLPS